MVADLPNRRQSGALGEAKVNEAIDPTENCNGFLALTTRSLAHAVTERSHSSANRFDFIAIRLTSVEPDCETSQGPCNSEFFVQTGRAAEQGLRPCRGLADRDRTVRISHRHDDLS